MNDSVMSYDQLKEIFGGSTSTDLAVRLEQQNIPYMLGKRGCPITTFSALNFAMGISDTNSGIIKEYKPTIEIE